MGETTGHVLWGSRRLEQERRELPSEDVGLGLRDSGCRRVKLFQITKAYRNGRAKGT